MWVRVVALLSAVCVVFAAGWMVNGWRWNSKLQAIIAAQTEARIAAEKKSRTLEQTLQAQINAERNRKDVEINIIRSQLDTALIELRKRPARGSNVPSTTGNNSPATGAQLSREDAEFLTREAARADVMLSNYAACYKSYESIRTSVGK
jgi:biopolymer transport protein ExbB/TolQ